MRTHLVLFLLFMAVSHAQEPTFIVPRLACRSEIGPLVLKAIDPEHLWISVAWAPNTLPASRRIEGKVPDETVTPGLLSIHLSYIEPRYSPDPAERKRFRQIFVEGVQKLLERDRPFWFEVTMDNVYAGPAQIGGVFQLDDWSGPTLQLEMVRSGYAVVSPHGSWPMVEKYCDDFRDKLLRLEGQAQAYNLGVWLKR